MTNKKIIIAVTGASGSIYAKQLIQKLEGMQNHLQELCIIFSENGKKVWEFELEESFNNSKIKEYNNTDLFSAPASGSARYTDMVIIPCSMGTMGKIANGLANDLIARAADVMLKERRNLVIVPREMPYNLIHIENMKKINLAGGIIFPASPSFYSKPQTKEEIVNTVVDRIIDMLGLESDAYRWGN